jgi:hypothetical protein
VLKAVGNWFRDLPRAIATAVVIAFALGEKRRDGRH